MRVAIVHYWLLQMRGGEKVVESLCRIFPDADLFTLFYNPEQVSPLIRSRHVTASYLNPFRRHYRSLLPVMPFALEHFDLSEYDLVISSESGPAKGVITRSDTRHICYCHTPMRYLWDLYPQYLHRWTESRWKKLPMAVFSHYLRLWDFASAARVDEFVANSENVRRRIQKAYRRDATVIHPPVSVDRFSWKPAQGFYLIVSELVSYKQIDLAVSVFARSGRRLKIVGDGPEYGKLKAMATANVEFCGRVPDEQLRELYSTCSALLMPGEEDFGIVSVEALASGKPVIGLRRGGLVEIVSGHREAAGLLFAEPTEAAFEAALTRFESSEGNIPHASLQALAQQYSEPVFARKMLAAARGVNAVASKEARAR